MWVRRSEHEIKEFLERNAEKNKGLMRPLIFGTAFGLLCMILHYFGLRGGTRGFYVFSAHSGFGPQTYVLGLGGFAMFFGLAFYHQKKGLPFLLQEKYLRCERCREIFNFTPEKTCRCGGKLEPSEFYTWEED
jgi:hypothetical protein